MSDKVAEISSMLGPDESSTFVVEMWERFNRNRRGWLEEKEELLRYVHATDTSTTSTSKNGWKNSTTIPKITQIRDNLHTNYMASLFPNDNWMIWEAFDRKSASADKAETIKAYMSNKLRMGGFEQVVDQLVLDYIDFGNMYVTTCFEARYNEDPEGALIPRYIGPKAVRINPFDIVYDITATSFENTPKIIRSLKSIGELKKLAEINNANKFWLDVIERRHVIRNYVGGIKSDDFQKANLYTADGFGNLKDYYKSDIVEILEFYGDWHDQHTGELQTNRMVTIVDRSVVVRNEPIPTYSGRTPIWHVGWRKRNNNLLAQGPLDNLVGMQYRLDHLENAKADAFDLAIHPPIKIIGEVEEFMWGPEAEIHLDEGGDVQVLLKDLGAVVTADNQMEILMMLMELMAGAPREAMGIRSPGEKTAFEVQKLDNASSRVFQNKTKNLEVNGIEPVLNAMLEEAHRHIGDSVDVIRTIDSDLGVASFKDITKEDITAKGILRPIGARHFADKANELQNVLGVFNSPLGQMLAPHTSAINLSKMVDDVLDIRGYEIFKANVAVLEQQETQSLINQAQEDNEVAQSVPPIEDFENEEEPI